VLLSRGRLLFRAGLLCLGGAFMLWRGWQARSAAPGLGAASRSLAERLGAVQALVGVLALVTAGATLWQLRPRRRRHSLHLDPPSPGPAAGEPPTPPRPPSGDP